MARSLGLFASSLISSAFVFILCLGARNAGIAASGSDGAERNAAAAALAPAGGTSQLPSFAGVLTWHNDNARDGQNLNETVLTTSNVTQTKFGKKFSYSVDGNVFAQPLYVPNVTVPGFGALNVVYVATENDSVYAFDADNTVKSALWKTSFINSAKGITTIPSSEVGCGFISPNIGITGTPVIDTTTDTLWVVAGTRQSGGDSWKLHALDITTGADKFGGPKTISATASGVSFNPKYQLQRGGLLVANGNVYISFGSYCDFGTYRGWLMAYNDTSLSQLAVFLVTPNGKDGSVWNGGGGPSADSSGNIYVTTANGTFDVNTGGTDYGDSFLKFNSGLSLLDYFTPFNQANLNSSDLDLGSGAVVLLPDQTGSHPHAMVGAGKEGRIYVVNRDNLGHYCNGCLSDTQIVQSIAGAFPQEAYPSGAYWNGNVYFASQNDVLKQYSVSQSLLSTTPVAKAKDTIGSRAATPSISANGTTNGIVWIINAKTKNSAANLMAYDATNVSTKLYDGTGVITSSATRFSVPTVANGKVYVGTKTQLVVFGLL